MNKVKLQHAFIIGVLILLGWRVLSMGMADRLAKDNPEQALFWRGSHPEALFRMAEQSASKKQWPEARRFAEKAVKANALDGRALRVLAQVAAQNGNEQQALSLFNKAVALSPRDVPSHAWLLEYALRRRQAKPAAIHLDALLRVSPKLMDVLMPQAMVLAINPAAQAAMIQQLALNPPWRRHLLVALAASKYSAGQIIPVFTGINAISKLEPGDYQPLIERLNKEGRYQQGYLTWANLIPEKQRAFLGNVFDGGFELPMEEQTAPFGWLIQSVDGAQVSMFSTGGTLGENSLYVEFEGRRTPFAHVSQTLALPSGQWLLSFRAKAERLDNVRGLVWRVVCQNAGNTLMDSEPMRGQFSWKEWQTAFSVPEDCPGQRLILMIPARIEAETLINGSVWVDDVKIQRLDGDM
jgi:tetratricopeptide (TPR) repeat protein